MTNGFTNTMQYPKNHNIYNLKGGKHLSMMFVS